MGGGWGVCGVVVVVVVVGGVEEKRSSSSGVNIERPKRSKDQRPNLEFGHEGQRSNYTVIAVVILLKQFSRIVNDTKRGSSFTGSLVMQKTKSVNNILKTKEFSHIHVYVCVCSYTVCRCMYTEYRFYICTVFSRYSTLFVIIQPNDITIVYRK